MADLPPQIPSPGEIFLDHVGWFVPDIEDAASAFERLGFALTPFAAQHNADPDGGPPVPAGTGNRCAMLRRGYLEILTPVAGVETPLAEQMRRSIARYAGVHLIAFTVADMTAAQSRLADGGFRPQAPVHLRRPIELADGAAAEVAFTVIRVPSDAMPEGRIQILTQETPYLVWQETLITRDNGVGALSGVLLCVPDPAGDAARFARFLDRKVAGRRQYFTIDLDRGRLAFTDVEHGARLLPGAPLPGLPCMAAVALAADDPQIARDLYAARGVALLATKDGTVRIAPRDAGGATLVIHPTDQPWPPQAL